jgi:hypothetical protein
MNIKLMRPKISKLNFKLAQILIERFPILRTRRRACMTGCMAHSASYSMVKAAGAWKGHLTSIYCRNKEFWGYTSLPHILNVMVLNYVMKYRDSFLFFNFFLALHVFLVRCTAVHRCNFLYYGAASLVATREWKEARIGCVLCILPSTVLK